MAGTNETIDFQALNAAPRLLMEAVLKPLQGDRFQPTGFADLGPARYTLPDGTEMLLVESAQSVANRMELACCKDDHRTLLDELAGLPYVVGKHGSEILTTSYLEAHRLSSPYLLNHAWATKLSAEMQLKDDFQINDRATVTALFKYDPCSLLHGVWLGTKEYKAQFSGGRVRLTRILSGFIEAKGIVDAESGGTKFDKNAARLTETGDAETGYGTLPFHRSEFAAEEIKAYFNLDLGLLRGYGLGENGTNLLIALALLKVRRFLSRGLRLRTACDLEVNGSLSVKRPEEFVVPSENDLLAECKRLIASCTIEKLFASPPVTEVIWEPAQKKAKDKGAESDDEAAGDND
jgi:CRISPR-associated protein Csb1